MPSCTGAVMRRRALAGLALGGALLLSPGAARGQETKGAITGQVLDAGTRQPIRAGIVELAPGGRKVLTDSLGRFAFPGLRAGSYALLSSSLGYRQATTPATTGAPALVLLSPEPVPLRAIEALARSSTRRIGGATLKVFGREQLLAHGNLSAAEFVRYRAHFPTRLCRTTRVRPGAWPALAGEGVEGVAGAGPSESWGTSSVDVCIAGAAGRTGPFVVTLDGQPFTYSDELWEHKAFELARVDVLYQQGANSFEQPFAQVRLYTPGYLARVAARNTHLCDRLTVAAMNSDPRLAELCQPGLPARR